MKIPTEKQCFALLEKYEVPGNVIRHSVLVDRVCMYIGKRLAEKGISVNLELLHAAGLLHDIAKIWCLGKKEKYHGKEGRIILEREGFPEVGKIVEVHQMKELIDGTLTSWEGKILNYADKRAGDKISPLGERFAYFRERYARYMTAINKAEPIVRKMEKEIFDIIGEKPESVEKLNGE